MSHTHADQGAAVMQNHALALQTVSALAHDLGNALIERVAERDMGNHTALEVGPWPHTLGAINHLVRDDKVARLDVLLETADGGEGNDAAHAD